LLRRCTLADFQFPAPFDDGRNHVCVSFYFFYMAAFLLVGSFGVFEIFVCKADGISTC
jgi:hypothetical protein